MKLAIIGAGEMAQELYLLTDNSNKKTNEYQEIILVDLVAEPEKNIMAESDFFELPKSDYKILIAMGEPFMRAKMRKKYLDKGYEFATFIHESAVVLDESKLEPGVVILPFVYVAQGTVLGENTMVHSGARIENDCVIGADSFVSSGAFVGAKTVVGESAFLGPNSAIKDKLTLGDSVIVGMGSNVIADVEKNAVVVGNPAKMIRENTTGKVF